MMAAAAMSALSSGSGGSSPMSSALDAAKGLTGGSAGPSTATQGDYTGGAFTVNAGLNMGNGGAGLDKWTILGLAGLVVVAYVFSKRK